MAIGPRRSAADDARYHNDLRRKVLDAHPEAANLIGPDWRTALFVPLMLALHWTIAWGVSLTSWWVAFLAAFVFGQTIYHSVGVLIHENAHRLVFRNAKARFAYDVLTEMIVTSFGYQLLYQHNHVTSHHAYLGDYDRDYEHEDANYVAARKRYRDVHPLRYRLLNIGIMLVQLLPFSMLVDVIFLSRFLSKETGLPIRDKFRKSPATRPSRGELYALAAVSLLVNIGLFMAFGFLGWLYHVWSMSFVSGRWAASLRGQVLSEHNGEDTQNPTRSTYWWGNWIFYNIGYHVEHHTFSTVPWMKLPKLRATAPEVFNLDNELTYYGWWWKQVKSDFTLPRRVSANEAESIIRRRPVEARANTTEDAPPATTVAA